MNFFPGNVRKFHHKFYGGICGNFTVKFVKKLNFWRSLKLCETLSNFLKFISEISMKFIRFLQIVKFPFATPDPPNPSNQIGGIGRRVV